MNPIAAAVLVAVSSGAKVGTFTLEHTKVRAEVSGGVARVEVSQRYANPYSTRLEAVYKFPLPENAAVTDMFLRVSSRVITSEVRERAEAKRIYEAARSSGRAAGLLEQERPNVFTQSVANIPPGEAIFVHVKYLHELAYDDGRYRFAFPATIGPRFIPEGVPDAARIAPPMLEPGERSRHELDVEVKLDAGLPIVGLRSPSHQIVVAPGSSLSRAVVALAPGDRIPNKDVTLEWGVRAARPELALLSHRRAEDGRLMLLLQPQARPRPEEVTPKEMVFVVDTSGSMSGEPIAKVKQAMRRAIKGMNAGDSFQIIRFDDAASAFAPRPLPNTPENVRAALSYINNLDGRGGTNMNAGIAAALDYPRDPGRRRIVFFMTDGFIGNESEIFACIRSRLGETRLFAFGVGSSVNRYLLDGMARFGRGFVQYVRPDEDTGKAVDLFYKRIRNPLLMDLAIDWGGLPVADVEPRELPDLFDAQPLTVLARYAGPSTGTIRVTGTLAGKPYARSLSVRLPKERAANAALAPLWARRRIGRLSDELHGGQAPEAADEIRALGLSHKLMTAYTSFVAVERVVRADVSLPLETVLIPNEMPEGVTFDGVFGKDQAVVSIPRLKPGDPVLAVQAPRGTVAVTADFPFGRRRLCAYDADRERWVCRFLVPRAVPDGRYAIEIGCLASDGTRTAMRAWYTVDSKAPVLDLEARRDGGEIVLSARPKSHVLELGRDARGSAVVVHDVRRVRARTADGRQVALKLAGRPGEFVWTARLSASGTLTVEAVDYAGNVSVQRLALP